MKMVYLDNAATTPSRPEVIEAIQESMQNFYANPSATYALGRSSKAIIEAARKSIAKHIGVESAEIIFTSGGTEANNLVLNSAFRDLGVKHIITSKIEHHAVLKTIEALQKQYTIRVTYIDILPNGDFCLKSLENCLAQVEEKTLVSLIHINNETGTILNLEKVGTLCKTYKAFFHTDTVQSIGHYKLQLNREGVHFATASAHKFYGPKGIGFAMVQKNSGIKALQFGGEQERGIRAGTEAIHQITGMHIALQLAYENLESDIKHISNIKIYAITQLQKHISAIKFNAKSDQSDHNYNLLNICLPISNDKAATTLFKLDLAGICVSRGSSCQSGSNKPSHVLTEILSTEDLAKTSLRISFSIYTTTNDIDLFIAALKKITA